MNQVIETMLNHKSIRKYEERQPSDDIIQSIVRAGQQAAFASQMYSILLSRKKRNPFGAPLLFTICADFHKMELIMGKRGWKPVTNNVSLLIFGLQDASYAAQNMVLAGESLGLGSCFLGSAPYRADKIIEEYKLPDNVFPMVQLVMGYPAENPPVRPRYPMDFVLFEDEYPEISDELLERSMKEMDDGYLAQDYYRKAKAKIHLEGDRKETYTYDDYSWTEHISRKWGQWYELPDEILAQLKKSGFDIIYDRK